MSQDLHHAKALVATCMDFRFQKTIHEWLVSENLYEEGFDRVSFAGSGGDLATLLPQIRLSVKLHAVSQVHILNHQNCGYYGSGLESGSTEELERHTKDLKSAKEEILKEYPSLQVFGYFVTLEQKVVKIDL